MDEKDRHNLAAHGFLVILLILASAMFVKQNPLTSARPGSAEKLAGRVDTTQDVEARLWQDPFAATDQHRRDAAAGMIAARLARGPVEAELARGPMDSRHDRNHFRIVPPDSRRVIVLPVMVLGGPYPEDAEQRRRSRYAVLSALIEAGRLRPRNERHIGYVDVDHADLPRVVPYEWLGPPEQDGDAPGVLVLWIDETSLPSRPLAGLATLLKELSLCERDLHRERRPPVPTEPVQLKVIGPQSTEVASRMAEEILDNQREFARGRKAEPPCFAAAGLYTLATARDLGHLGTATSLAQNNRLAGERLTALRAIGRDAGLVQAVFDELRIRGVDRQRDKVVFISEADSSYARYLLNASERHVCWPKATCSERVRTFHYIRGLDGMVPTAAGDIRADGRAPAGRERDPKPVDSERRERADGTSQFDYLRRLAAHITSTWPDVKAIGVFGNDVYDKLLILQAMRAEYPKTHFFTTDLDARLLHPQDSKWARNLIVASSFGLQLHPDVQAGVAPFRDTYQAALFLATRLAHAPRPHALPEHLTQEALDAMMLPRVFEIGRTTAVDLSPSEGKLQPEASMTVEIAGVPLGRLTLAGGGIAMLLAACMLYLSSLHVRAWVKDAVHSCRGHLGRTAGVGALAIAVLTAIILAVVVAANRDGADIEPFAWFEGVSLWPTELIRLAAFVVSLVLLYKLRTGLRGVAEELTGDFFAGVVDLEAARAHGRVVTAPPATSRLAPAISTFKRAFGVTMRPVDRPEPSIVSADLWKQYLYRASGWRRTSRIAVLSVSFIACSSAVLAAFGWPHVPYRGTLGRYVDLVVLWLAVTAVTVLLFAVTDAVWLCLRCARDLGVREPTAWPEETLRATQDALGLPGEYLAAWIDVQFIAAWTRRLVPMVYYPAYALGLMVAARSSVFDAWEPAPVGLTIVFAAALAYIAASAFTLRQMAERVRRLSRDYLVEQLIRARGAPVPVGCLALPGRAAQLEQLVNEVEGLRDGAFAPLSQQTFVRAVLLPLSGAGGLTLIQYLALSH